MIIGLTGYKGTGKSTVAKYINEQYGFARVNFKDGLVKEMKERLPDALYWLSLDTTDGDIDKLFEEKPPIMRALMQNYGTEVRRKDDQDYWVKQYGNTLATSLDKHFVTDDVRFQNEYDAVKLLGGVIIRIVRPDIESGGTHQSETEQESFEADFTIVAEPGSHDAAYRQVDTIIQTIKDNND